MDTETCTYCLEAIIVGYTQYEGGVGHDVWVHMPGMSPYCDELNPGQSNVAEPR